jgi:hypothetical protein
MVSEELDLALEAPQVLGQHRVGFDAGVVERGIQPACQAPANFVRVAHFDAVQDLFNLLWRDSLGYQRAQLRHHIQIKTSPHHHG